MLNPEMVRHLYERHERQTEDVKVFNDCCRGDYQSTLHAHVWGKEHIEEYTDLGKGLLSRVMVISFAFIVTDGV